MLIKVEWPWGDEDNLELNTESNKIHSILLTDLMRLSMTYDVIIDNGVITFVDKEQLCYSKTLLDK